MASVTMKQLLESGIHFGHQTRRWNPKMARYIHGERHGIYIIDLHKTLQQLRKAYITVRDSTANGGTVLFLGTKKQARDIVREHAERSGMFYVNNRWLGGTLTNWQTIQKSIKRLVTLEELESSGKIEQFTKKEAIRLGKQREKLDRNLCGIKNMEGPPTVLFIVDSHRETIAVREAARLKIQCIAICDTNSDPDEVSIPIPGNDDAIRAIQLFCSIIADAAIEGRGLYEKKQEDEAEKKKSASSKSPDASATGDEQAEKVESTDDGEDEAPPESLAEAEAAESGKAAEPVEATDS